MVDEFRCPFCGGRVRETIKFTTYDGTNVIRAGCDTCGSMVEVRGTNPMDALRALYDRLMPDGLTWPKWKDGGKVEFGDRFRTAGSEDEVITVQFGATGQTNVYGKAIGNSIERCTHVIPDTQERIDADARKTTCEFFGVKMSTPCQECPASHKEDSCDTMMHLDLLRRQRELDKREAEK